MTPPADRSGIERRLTVSKVEDESPFVRVTCWFHEGGTPGRSHGRTWVSFLCDTHQSPRIGQELTMTIGGLS